jgi:hypothetical protein
MIQINPTNECPRGPRRPGVRSLCHDSVLTVRTWLIVATSQAILTAVLTAIWILQGAPWRYGDLPVWFQIAGPIHLAAIVGWTMLSSKVSRT